MKTKPTLIAAALLLVAVCGFLFVRSKTVKSPEKAEVMAFLTQVNPLLKDGQTKSALTFFENNENKALNKILVNVLSGKTKLSGKSKPLFKVALDMENAGLDFTNPELIEARVIVRFEHPSLPVGYSSLKLLIHNIGNKQYKIYSVKTEDFRADYAKYQNKVINATVPETDLYKPITLAAFKTAEQLKARYDSVLWFQHINNKTWFYVVKGKVAESYYYEDELPADDKREKSDFKMGLVAPDLTEIIPVEYDLIHNIGGTIDSLIEVEKNGKKGFYNMAGKLVVPVNYEQILALNDGDNLALLKNGADYSYLKKDLSISDNITGLKIGDMLPKVKYLSGSFTLSEKSAGSLMEHNSRNNPTSLVISPSYMVELHILPKFMEFPNPLRTGLNDEDGGNGSGSIAVKHTGDENKEENWFQSAFYSVVNDYLGGRGGLYQDKQVVLVDKRQNKLLGFSGNSSFGEEDGGGELTGICNENSIRALNDSLFEFKTTAMLNQEMLTEHQYIDEGPYYYYLKVEKGKLVALKTERMFPTQFAKLDDSYLQACYVLANYDKDVSDPKKRPLSYTTPEILQIMKNEIYASYRYKFKNERWNSIFEYRFTNGTDTVLNVSVDDSLTAIDKYNIDFINRKLKITKPATLALK
ncbi:YARHG domain-containing protein [Mucilaginibacter sp.]|uniref:YARHG domain-containing protein n=1 Tax=Mucilaginibacter sp. TaxID=1882438 RepID=UPI0032639BDF